MIHLSESLLDQDPNEIQTDVLQFIVNNKDLVTGISELYGQDYNGTESDQELFYRTDILFQQLIGKLWTLRDMRFESTNDIHFYNYRFNRERKVEYVVRRYQESDKMFLDNDCPPVMVDVEDLTNYVHSVHLVRSDSKYTFNLTPFIINMNAIQSDDWEKINYCFLEEITITSTRTTHTYHSFTDDERGQLNDSHGRKSIEVAKQLEEFTKYLTEE